MVEKPATPQLGNILVVDDTPANLDLLVSMLKNNGYIVRPAPNGRIALQAAELEPPNLILLDISMPDMDGFAVCRQLKKNPKLSSIPVIFISALTESLDKVQAFKVGGVDYVTKPFQPDEVEARVSTHLKLYRYQAQLENWNLQLASKVQEQTQNIQLEINERIKAQALIEEEKELLATTLLSIQDGVVTTDSQGIVTLLNRSAEAITGFIQEEACGKEITEILQLVDEETNQPVRRELLRPFNDHPTDISQNTKILVAKDGKRKVVSNSMGVVINKNGGLSGYVFVFSDITQQRIMEAQFALAQKMDGIGQLAAGIAHEINTPIQYVGDNLNFLERAFLGYQQVLEQYDQFARLHVGRQVEDVDLEQILDLKKQRKIGLYQTEIPGAIQESLEGIERVRKIVLAIREFSHPSEKEKKFSDLNHGIQTTITISRNEWKYSAELETDLDPDLPPVYCQIDEINQVILNMIVNAAHAIQEVVSHDPDQKGIIYIRTRQKEDRVLIFIQDTGCGIPEAIRNRIFDPFFTTKEVGKGTGQGLYMAHNIIVKKHGGKIQLESVVGQGTTFTIDLPIEERGASVV